MTDKYSFTKLTTYEDCPRRYSYEFVDKAGVGPPDNIHAVVGRLVHEAIASFHRAVPKPTPVDGAVILRIYDDLLDKVDPGSFQIPLTRPVQYYFKRGRALVHGYVTQWPALFSETVVAVERALTIRVGTDYGMTEIDGIADKISATRNDDLIVTDFKTTPSPPPHDSVEDFHQTAIYWMGLLAAGETRRGLLRYHYLDSQICAVHEADLHTLESAQRWIQKSVDRIESDKDEEEWEARAGVRCRTCRFGTICPEGVTWLRSSLARDRLF